MEWEQQWHPPRWIYLIKIIHNKDAQPFDQCQHMVILHLTVLSNHRFITLLMLP